MDSSRSIRRRGEEVRVEVMADLVVIKTSDWLEASLPVLLVSFGYRNAYDICACRVERLTNANGGQQGAIVRFLEALREDWTNHSHDECNYSWCRSEHDEPGSCTFGHDLKSCDVHPGGLLY